jgi:AcrR family transcriptional regulator
MTKNEPKETRLRQIIDAAVVEFVEKGYEQTSMQSIAKQAGLTKGGLYYHFKSKDEILMEANNRYMEPILALMTKAQENENPLEGLKQYIKAYIQHWETHPKELTFTFLSLTKMMQSKDMMPMIESYADLMTEFFGSLFRKGISKKKFREHNYVSRAVSIFATLNGITAYVAMNRNLTAGQVADHIIEVYINEISKH